MNERLIPRPNSFSIEEWESLGREKQIQWYKSQPQPAPTPLDSSTLPRLAQICSRGELVLVIFTKLTDENVREVISNCPNDVMQILKESSAELPSDSDDVGWGKRLYIRGVCYAPWVTDEEIQAQQDEERRRFRNGVRLFRANLSEQPSTN